VRRREFIALFGGAAAVWPIAGQAQQSAMPVIGFLNSASPETFGLYVEAFAKGLQESGFVDGRNVAMDFRWAGMLKCHGTKSTWASHKFASTPWRTTS
jgi:hypothetical protein